MNKVYNIDCMEFLKDKSDNFYDLAIVDPPYGGSDAIGLKDNKNNKKQATKRTNYKLFENKEPDKKYWNELFRVSKNQVIWGVNFYSNFNFNGGRLCWDKKGTAFGRAELAFLSMTKSVNICEITWNGMLQENMKNKEIRIHPTQKPVALYKWLLKNYARPNDKILDTHIGSGSIRIACHDLGFDLEGCELDKDYFDAQEKRFNDYIKQADLFSVEEYQELIYDK